MTGPQWPETGLGTALPPWWGPLVAAASEASGPQVPKIASDTALLYSPEDARAASVLVLLSDRAAGPAADRPSVLLQQRASGLRHHPGEVAFPGGAADPGDADAAATALREAAEELAVDPGTVAIGPALPPLWIPVSGFAVTPVLALWTAPHPVTLDDDEVAAAHQVSLARLADPGSRGSVRYPSGRSGPGFRIPGVPLIWGFTAGVLSWLLDLGGWSLPWNTGRTMELEGF